MLTLIVVSALGLLVIWMLVKLFKVSREKPHLSEEEMRDEINTW